MHIVGAVLRQVVVEHMAHVRMCRPREATSVAISTASWPLWNSFM
jgi:hypothetical protein